MQRTRAFDIAAVGSNEESRRSVILFYSSADFSVPDAVSTSLIGDRDAKRFARSAAPTRRVDESNMEVGNER